jgi:hypothetical protein
MMLARSNNAQEASHTKISIISSVLAGTNYIMELHSITAIP